MAARKRKILHDEETRSRIQASVIIRRFMDCLEGKITLDPTQVSVGKALINKVLPDLSAIQQQTETTITYVAELPPVHGSTAEWLKAAPIRTKPNIQ